jgi:hypothetical protein
LGALQQRVEPRLHLSPQTTKVTRLLGHDRVDATLLLGSEIELACKPIAHPVARAAFTPAAATDLVGWESWTPQRRRAKAVAVQRQPFGGEAKPHAGETDDDEQCQGHRLRGAAARSHELDRHASSAAALHRTTAAVKSHSPDAGPTSAFIT